MQTARTTPRLRTALLSSAAALSLALVATPAAAQRRAVVVTAAAPASEGARARANWLVSQAEGFDVGQGQEGRYFTIARLYRTAAQLRGVDTAAVTHYRLAAWSLSAGGDNTAALRTMTRAAELAVRVEDVDRAIGSYLDAAMLAKAAGRLNEIVPVMREVDVLLASPRLSDEQRTAHLERIAAEPTLALAFAR